MKKTKKILVGSLAVLALTLGISACDDVSKTTGSDGGTESSSFSLQVRESASSSVSESSSSAQESSAPVGSSSSDDVDSSNHEHSYDTVVTTKDADCTNDGTVKKSCSCGASIEETIPALGHLTSGSCNGGEVVCERCGATVAATHDWVDVEKTEPTCLDSGREAYTYCANCGTYKDGVRGAVIAPLGHDFGENDEKCSRCEAENPAYISTGLEYELNSVSDPYYIVKGIGTCKDTKVIIPSTYEGKPVKEIMLSAFKDTEIETIVIPEGVTQIRNIFGGSSKLKTVIIQGANVELAGSAFKNCGALESVIFESKVANVTLGDGAFRGCEALKNIDLSNITEIGTYAFAGCVSLANLEMSEKTTKIGERAFSGCVGFTKIVIPDNVTELGLNAFAGCGNVTEITVGNGVTNFNYAFTDCVKLQKLVIGNGITEVSISEFSAWKDLASVKIGDGVTDIANVFLGKAKLETVELGNGITTLKSNAFNGCVALKNIIFGKVTTIEADAFKDCAALEVVELGDDVVMLEAGAFNGCTALKDITLGNVATIEADTFKDCVALENLTFGKSMTTFKAGAFALSDNKTLKIGAVHYQGTLADWCAIDFEEAASNPLSYGAELRIDDVCVTEVQIIRDVVEIKPYAFYNYSHAKALRLHGELETIGKDAFNGCSAKTLTIGKGVTTIAEDAFKNCKLTEVFYQGDVAKWCGIDFANEYAQPLNGGATLYIDNYSAETISIPATVTEIKPYAFYNCTTLERIYIQKDNDDDGVQTIGKKAFSGCENLKNVYYDGTLTEWYTTITFEDNAANPLSDGKADLYTSENNATLPFTLVQGTLEISATATEIKDYAFYNYHRIEKLTFEGRTEPLTIGKYAFAGCAALNEVVISSRVTELGEYAFANCETLGKAELGQRIQTLGKSAFENCVALEELTFKGNKEAWDEMTKGDLWNFGICATEVSCSDGKVTL